MMENFKESIKEWVTLDNELKTINEHSKDIRDRKTDKFNEMLSYVENNNLDNAVIQISDGRLKFQNTKVTTPLTFKFIEKCLNDLIPSEEQVERIIAHIKEQRETKINKELKRYYN